jgi:dTDP-4-amino-4,6-dideoxygalactose transaminase
MSPMMKNIPMARPNPPRLSEHALELAAIEESGTYSNFGPMAKRLERGIVDQMFTSGECVSVCNATLGLMIAIRQVIGNQMSGKRRFALMPSFTFAATAHAALWNGLTPLFCDVDPDTWLPSEEAEEALLREYGEQIAVIVPYATFGNNLDLAHYDDLYARYGVPIVVDAAASLGSCDTNGRAFGDGSRWPIAFSMHATKPFSTGEGGVLYCADEQRAAEMRAMASFGFEQPRVATLPGLNAKMSEVAALTGCLQLEAFEGVVLQRTALKEMYRSCLPRWTTQRMRGKSQIHTFESVLLPKEVSAERPTIMAELRERGIGTGTYFSPHLAEQPYFAATSVSGPLPCTEELSARVLTLPMFEAMTMDDVKVVADTLQEVVGSRMKPMARPPMSVRVPRFVARSRRVAVEQRAQSGL